MYANAVYFTGALPATTPVAATVGSFPAGVGRWDTQKADPNLVLQSTVDQQAAGVLADESQLVPAITATLRAGTWNPYNVWLGDTVRVIVRTGRLDVDVSRRVIQIDVTLDDDGVEVVALAIGAAPARLSDRLNTIANQIAQLQLAPQTTSTSGGGGGGGGGGGAGGLYASLTGPGETDVAGKLTQAGGFTVWDLQKGDGILLQSLNGGIELKSERSDSNQTTVRVSARNSNETGTAAIYLQSYDVGRGGIVIQSGVFAFPVVAAPDQTDLVASKDVRIMYGYGLDAAAPYGAQAALVLQSGQTTKSFGPVHIYVTGFDPNSGTDGVTARAIGDLCIDQRPTPDGPNLWQAFALGRNWRKISP